MAVAAIKVGAKVVDAIGGQGTSLKIGLFLVGAMGAAVAFVLVIVITLLTSIMAALSGAASTAYANCNGGSSAPSPVALTGIPAVALDAYQKAGAATGVNWTYIAAIGEVESGHGSNGGSVLGVNGEETKPVFGPVLDGSGVGGNTTPVFDTDKGALDKNTKYDRAVGPMQFMPSTWLSVGQDGNFDGKKDPQNIADAALATGMYLKQSGAPADMTKAILSYNHSMDYVRLVQGWAQQYGAATPGPSVVNVSAPLTSTLTPPSLLTAAGSAWSMPLKPGTYTLTSGFGPRLSPGGVGSTVHLGVDLGAPIGTPIYAVGAGTVIESGPVAGFGNWILIKHGGVISSSYGHMKVLLVQKGQTVAAGQPIALVGNEGDSTGPHLDLRIYRDGTPISPLPFLAGNEVNLVNDGGGCGLPADSVPPGPAGKVVTFANSTLGKPYMTGGKGPAVYDAAGLAQAAYAAAGVTIPPTTKEQWSWSKAVTVANGQELAGDLIFFNGSPPSHVAIVLDPTTKTMIHTGAGDVAKIATYGTPTWTRALSGFKRMPGGGTPPAGVPANPGRGSDNQ